ncbi:hypothetical protein [Nitratifractor sp.]
MHKGNNTKAMSLAIAFFKGNVTLSLIATGVLIGVALLQFVPIVGVFFLFVYPVLAFAIQVYVGRLTADVTDEDDMAERAAESTLGDLFLKHIDVAVGGFLGFFLIFFTLGMIFFLLLGTSVDFAALSRNDAQAFVVSMLTPGNLITLAVLLIVGTFLGYVFPGVMGEVILADDFAAAFKKSLLLLSPKFWKRTFNGTYFVLVLVWSLIVMAVSFVISVLGSSIVLLPVALVLVYLLSLYNASVYIFAHDALE